MLSWSQISRGGRGGHRDRRAQPAASPAGPVARQQLREELPGEQGTARGPARVAGARAGLPVRLLQRRGCGRWPADVGHEYACAVGNTLPGADTDPLALPRLTIRRSTGCPSSGRSSRGKELRADLPQGPGADQGLGHGPPHPGSCGRHVAWRVGRTPATAPWGSGLSDALDLAGLRPAAGAPDRTGPGGLARPARGCTCPVGKSPADHTLLQRKVPGVRRQLADPLTRNGYAPSPTAARPVPSGSSTGC